MSAVLGFVCTPISFLREFEFVVLISQASSEYSITFATNMVQANVAKGAIEEEFHKEIKQVSWLVGVG